MDNGKYYQCAVTLRDMLIAYVTGRTINEAEFGKLRSYLLNSKSLSPLLPQLLKNHADPAEIWREVKYGQVDHQARRDYLIKCFAPLINHLAGDKPASNPQSLLNEQSLQAQWAKATKQVQTNAEVACEQMKVQLEALCYQLLREHKVIPDPRNSHLSALIRLTQNALSVAPRHRFYHTIEGTISATGQLSKSIDSLTLELVTAGKGAQQIAIASLLLTLYLSLGLTLLAAWRCEQLAEEGNRQR